MAYSTNPETLKAMLTLLEPLANEREAAWKSDDPKALAYKIREALSIARRYAGDYPALARAADRFTIEVLEREGIVQARFARSVTAQTVDMPEPSLQLMPVEPLAIAGGHGAEPAGGAISIADKQTVYSIIETWTSAQLSPRAGQKITWSGAALSDAELDRLARWASARTPLPWHVISNPPAVTLHPHDLQVEEISWKPGLR